MVNFIFKSSFKHTSHPFQRIKEWNTSKQSLQIVKSRIMDMRDAQSLRNRRFINLATLGKALVCGDC